MDPTWSGLERYRDHALLFLRVGLGLAFMGHGVPKLLGGPDRWANLGTSMALLGIDFAPTFWGFMASVAEGVGGFLLVIGLLVRPASVLMACTMVVAVLRHIDSGDSFGGWSHAMEAGIVFVALVVLGGGRFSLDARISGRGAPASLRS